MDVQPDALIGSVVRAQVSGWKASRRGDLSAPLLTGVPLHVTGTLGARSSPVAGTIYTVDGMDVDAETVTALDSAIEWTRWDDPGFVERADARSTWRAALRQHQSWYRDQVLGLPPGTIDRPEGPRAVSSMLTDDAVEADPTLNFLTEPGFHARAMHRLEQKDWGGMIDVDRLSRNLLSSQPLCFSLFGTLLEDADAFLRVLREVLALDAHEIRVARFEWSPHPNALQSGAAFDFYLEYTTGEGSTGFVGFETKYAENLADQKVSANPAYAVATEAERSGFKRGAAERLAQPRTCQLWYNALLARAHLAASPELTEAHIALLACRKDESAFEALGLVRDELQAPDELIRQASYEDIVAVARNSEQIVGWAEHFAMRYLDLTRQTWSRTQTA